MLAACLLTRDLLTPEDIMTGLVYVKEQLASYFAANASSGLGYREMQELWMAYSANFRELTIQPFVVGFDASMDYLKPWLDLGHLDILQPV